MLIDITNPITDWILPRRCVVCDEDIHKKYLCAACLSLCSPCAPGAIEEMRARPALFFYENTIKALIINAKFNHSHIHAHALLDLIDAELLSKRFKDIEAFSPTAISFVPSHWLNQIPRVIDLPRLFANLIAQRLSLSCKPFLVRMGLRRQIAQKSSRERRDGITGAFELRCSSDFYERILIVDDIVTTGATLMESQRMLKQISDKVAVLAIARTP